MRLSTSTTFEIQFARSGSSYVTPSLFIEPLKFSTGEQQKE